MSTLIGVLDLLASDKVLSRTKNVMVLLDTQAGRDKLMRTAQNLTALLAWQQQRGSSLPDSLAQLLQATSKNLSAARRLFRLGKFLKYDRRL
jgi:ABC-type transporter Mla subunit MlaD